MGTTESVPFSSDLPHFTNAEGARIYTKRWSPQGSIRAVVFICHGVHEHVERHNPLASILAEKGFLVVGHDHVGHGRSDGIRADCEDFNWYVRDTLQHVQQVKEELPDIPFFLFGYSMGGAVAILAALESSHLFSGAILVAPMIMPKASTMFSVKVWLLHLVSSLFPQLGVGTSDPNGISRDPEVVKASLEDPLNYHGNIKARWGACALAAMDEIQKRMEEVKFSYLLLHGTADRFVPHEGSEMFHAKTQSEDKTLKLYPDHYHRLFSEPKEYSDVVIADIISWLETHVE